MLEVKDTKKTNKSVINVKLFHVGVGDYKTSFNAFP